VGMKVLDPLRACVKVADYCGPSFVGTLTSVKSIVTSIENVLPPCLNNSQ
jgi:hypothetical protein